VLDAAAGSGPVVVPGLDAAGRDGAELDALTSGFDHLQPAFGPHPRTYTGPVLQALAGVPERDGPSGGRPCLVELGCGTATWLAAMAERDTGLRCVGVEADPVLLRLAQRAAGVDVVEGDFRSAAWLRSASVRAGEVDVVLAARALHYPDPDELAGIYAYLGRWLRPGGVLVNADRFPDPAHQVPADESPAALGAWSQWWVDARACRGLADAFRDRDSRPPLGAGNRLTAADHGRLLQVAGFAAVELADLGGGDVLVVARR
jgi:SAM-dependent methyltransferase